jgi:aryl-alcohol dehydrogenase (NADP+)
VVLLTKGRSPVREQPGAGLRVGYLRAALDASLHRLGVDRVDVYLAHGPDRDGSLEELADFFADIVATGKARAVGVCNFPGWQLTKLVNLCDRRGGVALSMLQVQYSLLAREVEWEVLPAACDAGIGPVVWGATCGGLFDPVATPASTPRHPWDPTSSERTESVASVVRHVADALAVSAEAVAIAWTLAQSGITAAIIGAPDPQTLHRRIGAVEIALEPEIVRQLDDASRPPTPAYPYAFIDWFSSQH